MPKYQAQGFVALFSVLVLSALLLGMAVSADVAAYAAHEAESDEHSYRMAQEAALSCARFSFARLDADPLRFSNTPTTTIRITDESLCRIISASSTGNSAGSSVEGVSGESTVPLYATAVRATSAQPFALETWTEY